VLDLVVVEEEDTTGDDFTHVYCPCDEVHTLCGLERGDGPVLESDAEVTCIVCADLDDKPCVRCGK